MSGERALDAFERLRVRGQLAGLEAADRPLWLPLTSIKTAPVLFQMREGDTEGGATDPGHVLTLLRALRAKPAEARTLDPVLVFGIAEDAYCIDGHHRLAAYRDAKVTGPVPVEWFRGTLEGAVGEAISRNQKAKLQMGSGERMEGAWRLVVIGGHTKAATAAMSGVSERSVATLRELLRAYLARYRVKPPGSLWEVRSDMDDDGGRPDFTEDMEEAMIDGFRTRLLKTFGKEIGKHSSLFAEALHRVSGEETTRSMSDYWGHVSEDNADCPMDGDDDEDTEF
ncbi:MAG: hypothetical protein Q8Q62_15560 [Mesorhizobium sp.]|nr:hypothetical protein [Mesorhizobium sp.]